MIAIKGQIIKWMVIYVHPIIVSNHQIGRKWLLLINNECINYYNLLLNHSHHRKCSLSLPAKLENEKKQSQSKNMHVFFLETQKKLKFNSSIQKAPHLPSPLPEVRERTSQCLEFVHRTPWHISSLPNIKIAYTSSWLPVYSCCPVMSNTK